MKDMSIVLNKKIVNKETNEVRLVVKIDEENRKIYSVPAWPPLPMIAAGASAKSLSQKSRPSRPLPSLRPKSRRPRPLPQRTSPSR